jgi:hypothetical protein
VLAGLRSGNYLSTASLEGLVGGNQCYQEARRARRGQRRQAGEGLELDLPSAALEFLQLAEEELSRREFKNLEVLLALLLAFYAETPGAGEATTRNYVQHINGFTKRLLQEACREDCFRGAFALQTPVALQLLEVFHQWLLSQKLTQHELQINPLFALPPLRTTSHQDSIKQEQ